MDKNTSESNSNEKTKKLTKERRDNMATLTCPTKSPFIVKEGKSEQFIEKCSKTRISLERRKQLMEFSKSIRRGTNVNKDKK